MFKKKTIKVFGVFTSLSFSNCFARKLKSIGTNKTCNLFYYYKKKQSFSHKYYIGKVVFNLVKMCKTFLVAKLHYEYRVCPYVLAIVRPRLKDCALLNLKAIIDLKF